MAKKETTTTVTKTTVSKKTTKTKAVRKPEEQTIVNNIEKAIEDANVTINEDALLKENETKIEGINEAFDVLKEFSENKKTFAEALSKTESKEETEKLIDKEIKKTSALENKIEKIINDSKKIKNNPITYT